MTNTSENIPQEVIDNHMASRMESDAQMLRLGEASFVAGQLLVSAEKQQDLAEHGQAIALAGSLAVSEAGVEQAHAPDFLVRKDDLLDYARNSNGKWRPHVATRAWSALFERRNRPGENTEIWNATGLKVIEKEADTPQERYALSGRSIASALQGKTIKTLPEFGKASRELVTAYVHDRIAALDDPKAA